MITYQVKSYDADGALVRDFTAEVDEADGARFIAHQVLHADGVVAVEVLDPVSGVALRAADPGLTFDEVVRR